MNWGVLYSLPMAACGEGDVVSSQKLIQGLVYSFPCLSANSELEKDGHTALNTHSVSPLEKIKQYQAGQTVTCFLKKVRGACLAMRCHPQKRGEAGDKGLTLGFDSVFATICGRPYRASLLENFLV